MTMKKEITDVGKLPANANTGHKKTGSVTADEKAIPNQEEI